MATSESKGRFFYKTNRFESIRITNRIDLNRELECSSLLHDDGFITSAFNADSASRDDSALGKYHGAPEFHASSHNSQLDILCGRLVHVRET